MDSKLFHKYDDDYNIIGNQVISDFGMMHCDIKLSSGAIYITFPDGSAKNTASQGVTSSGLIRRIPESYELRENILLAFRFYSLPILSLPLDARLIPIKLLQHM